MLNRTNISPYSYTLMPSYHVQHSLYFYVWHLQTVAWRLRFHSGNNWFNCFQFITFPFVCFSSSVHVKHPKRGANFANVMSNTSLICLNVREIRNTTEKSFSDSLRRLMVLWISFVQFFFFASFGDGWEFISMTIVYFLINT